MRHEFFDHHRQGNSLVHHLDPRLKTIMIASFILPVVLLPFRQLDILALYGIIPFGLALFSRVSILHFLSKLLRLYPMILFISIFIPFIPVDSSHDFRVGFFRIYSSGLQQFILINVKAIWILLMTIVLTTTTDFMLILRGMEKFRIPPLVISIISFMYRFIFLIVDELERLQMGFQSRYVYLPYGRRLKIFANLMGLLFIRSYERGERIYLAMESRGFQGKIFTLDHLSWKSQDSVALGIFILLLAAPFSIGLL